MDFYCIVLLVSTEIPGRPKSVKLFLQTHAGSKSGSSFYKNKVTPLFQAADIHVDFVGK